MRIAVLGVGLIGGSIGLAAKRRLGAEVAGYDPDAAILERALEREALDAAHGSVAEAVAGADVVFCAAPVGALPAIIREALEAAPAEAVVTDVGSTKRELVAELGAGPAASASSAGTRWRAPRPRAWSGARADLFEGARWYLTPTEGSSGVHYDRLQRAIADLGARPQAIDAATHDRLMATVSHLPHVLANVLASQAAAASADESERMPEVGSQLPRLDPGRGRQPRDLGATSSRPTATRSRPRSTRSWRACSEAAELLRAGDSEAVAAWHRGARDDRRALLEGEAAGGPLHELRVVVDNRPGTVAEIALALGRGGGQHRGHGARPRRRHGDRRDHALGRGRGRGAGARPRRCAGSATRRRRSPGDE